MKIYKICLASDTKNSLSGEDGQYLVAEMTSEMNSALR